MKDQAERQAHCDKFAQGVAHEVWKETGVLVGWHAKINTPFRRVEFSFRYGADKWSFPVETFEVIFNSIALQPVFDAMIMRVLKDTCPWGWAQRQNRIKNAHNEPEIPIFVDQQGRRHHTLKAETFIMGAKAGEATLQKRGPTQ